MPHLWSCFATCCYPVEDLSVVASVLVLYHCMTKVKVTMDQYMDVHGGIRERRITISYFELMFLNGNIFCGRGVRVDAGSSHLFITITIITQVVTKYSYIRAILSYMMLMEKHV